MAGAAALADAGCDEPLDVRRSLALGDLARGDQPLGLTREVVLHVHHAPDDEAVRVEAGGARHLATVEQVRAWCRAPHARVTVRPVVDLGARLSCAGYTPSAALADQVVERDRTCVFPWCTRTARACDLDHVVPHDEGGPTSSDNLAALCRHHHRLKTHAGWSYTILEPATYLWRSPHGLAFLRDRGGTQALDPPPGPGG